MLLDEGKNPIYYNAEALKILSRPQGGTEAARSGFFAKKTLSSLLRRALSENGSGSTEFVSGRRRYTCRTFSVFQEAPSAEPVTGLLIEPSNWNATRESEIAQKFHLSKREEETVSLLSLGLTSKEIALRMGVSPNTIKVFLRLIMTKMAVSTRSGIIGKLLRYN